MFKGSDSRLIWLSDRSCSVLVIFIGYRFLNEIFCATRRLAFCYVFMNNYCIMFEGELKVVYFLQQSILYQILFARLKFKHIFSFLLYQMLHDIIMIIIIFIIRYYTYSSASLTWPIWSLIWISRQINCIIF